MTSRVKDLNGVSGKKRAQDVSCHVAPGASAKNFPRARVEGPVQLATHDSEPLYDTRPVTVKRYVMFDKILQTLSICSVLAVVVLATGAACAQELNDRDVAALSKLATTGTVEQKYVAAAEAANNFVSGANIIPLLTLGIPGSVAAALLGGVFLIHGMNIGPKIFETDTEIIYGLFASGLLCIATYFVMGYWGSGIIGKIIAKVPVRVIYPFIFITSIVAVYALRNTLFDVGMMFVFGFVGYFFKKFDYSLPAFIIAFILGPGAERALRQALLLSEDGAMIFAERPLAIFFIFLAVLVIGVRIYQSMRTAPNTAKAT